MASIRQFQRRAIESLQSHMVEPRHPIESVYSLRPVISANFLMLDNQQPLKVLGISDGTGTCSDIHGMNILVLSADQRSRPQHEVSLVEIQSCAYAVLLRPATQKEAKKEGFNLVYSFFCVELLRITDIATDYTNMELTGRRAYYVATV